MSWTWLLSSNGFPMVCLLTRSLFCLANRGRRAASWRPIRNPNAIPCAQLRPPCLCSATQTALKWPTNTQGLIIGSKTSRTIDNWKPLNSQAATLPSSLLGRQLAASPCLRHSPMAMPPFPLATLLWPLSTGHSPLALHWLDNGPQCSRMLENQRRRLFGSRRLATAQFCSPLLPTGKASWTSRWKWSTRSQSRAATYAC